MYEDSRQNYDPEIHEEYLMHDTPVPLPATSLAIERELTFTFAICEECGVSPQPIPEFPLRHSSKFNKIKIHTHTHTLYLSTDFLYFIFIHFIKLHF